ncbi:hypothetical protein C0583_01335 [Candidatus Parcubacteria bacterium]|nr:MAG: hypothetical protein C0583_01335 [Candidatus Parcubacteria bacterium]
MKKVILVIFVFSCFIVPFSSLQAGGCLVDPIYKRNNTGEPKIGLYLRDIPCMEGSEILKVLPASEEIELIAYTDGWYKVKDKTGAIGWAGSSLINETSQNTASGKYGSEYFRLGVNKGVDEAERKRMLARTKGYILLQVESKGEAWYVDPETEQRYYMRDGFAAFEIMRNFGLGISNENLAKLQNGDEALKNRLIGKIVLQIEENGEAFYISPQDRGVHYLQNGAEAYRIMREQGLGITNTDLSALSEGSL